MGHLQATGRTDLPPRERPLLDPRCAPRAKSARRGPRLRNDSVQIGTRAPGFRHGLAEVLLREGSLFAHARVQLYARCAARVAPPNDLQRHSWHRGRPSHAQLQHLQQGREQRAYFVGRRGRLLRADHLLHGHHRLRRRSRRAPRLCHSCGVFDERQICRAGQDAPVAHQELPERGGEALHAADRRSGRPVLRGHQRPPHSEERGPHRAVRPAGAQDTQRAAGAPRQVRGVE
mmetsp:Transcript_12273/g.20525  ORF Transcript_12273/g.20525 Transcript_12273/m.20525 type:complete len:232 (-) Transcript_12273:2392-3087(-)